MSTEDGWRNRLNLMGWDNLNALDRWRADNARREEELARQRRAEKRERRQREEQTAVDQLRAEMQREVANLRAEMFNERELVQEVVGTAIGEFSHKQMDHVEKAIREIRDMLSVAIERRFGELMGRLDALTPGASSRAKSFKFANEDDNVADLPNPLRKGMN